MLGCIHNNADELSRLVQPKMPDGTTSTPHEQNPIFVSTIRVKLSSGRTAIFKLESSKPLIVDPDGNLVDIHDHPGATCTSPQKVNQTDAITLNPTMNLGHS